MIEQIAVVLRLLAEVFGVVGRPLLDVVAAVSAPDAGALTIAAATATTLTALALLAVAIALFVAPARSIAAAPRPRAIADLTRLTETHPDAPGHARPRAPGRAALAA